MMTHLWPPESQFPDSPLYSCGTTHSESACEHTEAKAFMSQAAVNPRVQQQVCRENTPICLLSAEDLLRVEALSDVSEDLWE